ncbi:MAG: TlyA family RNA methyltransferase [Nitrospiraceae bacterium]
MDCVLVTRGFAASRELAGRLILAGAVKVDGVLIDKQGRRVPLDARIDIAQGVAPFVSRGGEKLAAALDAFLINPTDLIGLDVGCSTGGFTDCLLQRGARRIYAVDVGYGQLDWHLRQDQRVVVLERQNIRYLPVSAVSDPIDIAVVDVSFISLTIVLPCITSFLATQAVVIALIKPQFEVGRGQVGRGGIVRDDAKRRAVTGKIINCAKVLGLSVRGFMDSPILGQKGNREIVLALSWVRGASEKSN